ncbi:Uncharacterised protein [Campylobacter hyointestinalis subsp. hyointestinalis]|uniref:Uncharacterized protein n=1 Tax=Campylobacter hyointestinalis subsp. hyointestinalis TaxID=91352 RepID=A0A9W5ATZ7_CAMHY|nr:hypothetical protein [Campylobacter hyointestinalis]CUU84949.1 Uncharacterised protein [Campylobacter hyointestinalis subsp. hyointestinalis]
MINQNTLGKQISQDTDQNESLLPSIKHNRKSKIIKLYVSIALAMIVWFLPRSIFPFRSNDSRTKSCGDICFCGLSLDHRSYF